MRIQDLNLNHRRIVFISLLCCTVIAASLFTLKSNCFRSMWSLADSNVEALSISENYSDFRYVGYIYAEKTTQDGPDGNSVYLNQCNNGTGACMYDKWRNNNGKFSIDCVIYAYISCCSEILTKVKEICSEIQDEGGLMTAIAALFK